MRKLDVRAEMHKVIGALRRGEWIIAYELVIVISKQLDDEYYGKDTPND